MVGFCAHTGSSLPHEYSYQTMLYWQTTITGLASLVPSLTVRLSERLPLEPTTLPTQPHCTMDYSTTSHSNCLVEVSNSVLISHTLMLSIQAAAVISQSPHPLLSCMAARIPLTLATFVSHCVVALVTMLSTALQSRLLQILVTDQSKNMYRAVSG